jgi:hypothetical protein
MWFIKPSTFIRKKILKYLESSGLIRIFAKRINFGTSMLFSAYKEKEPQE